MAHLLTIHTFSPLNPSHCPRIISNQTFMYKVVSRANPAMGLHSLARFLNGEISFDEFAAIPPNANMISMVSYDSDNVKKIMNRDETSEFIAENDRVGIRKEVIVTAFKTRNDDGPEFRKEVKTETMKIYLLKKKKEEAKKKKIEKKAKQG